MKLNLLVLNLLLLFGIVSCSYLTPESSLTHPNLMTEKDYLQHYASMGPTYLHSEGVHEEKLAKDKRDYLEKVYNRIISNNETLFNQSEKPEIYIIKNNTPFVFSLPGNQYYFSSGVFKKYFKSEDLFIAAFAGEIVKNKRNVFEKKQLIPLGFISTEKMIQLTRVPLAIKKQINEWAFIVLRRAGYDASAYLNWIQIQNRNSLDFAMYLGNSVDISSEEQAFKSFISKQGIVGLERKWNEANSSKEYYELVKGMLKEEDETRTIRKNSSRRVI